MAHILLSYPSNDEMLGNFLGDFVRKKDMAALPSEVQIGVNLHRVIDHYTDRHSAVKDSVALLKPMVGRYASVAIDIINDYFLCQFWEDYSAISIRAFCDHFYFLLNRKKEILPMNLTSQMNKMIDHDFLMSTYDRHRLYNTMKYMEGRTSFKSNFTSTLAVIDENEAIFQENFKLLFDDLVRICDG
ncbi:MAG: ACP phosphodiesterase [Saprospiraceae bacterium]